MKITQEEHPPFTILRAVGSFDTQTAPLFRDAANACLQADKRHLVLDLTGLEFLDSSGLSTLVNTWTTIKRLQGLMRIVAVPGPVLRVLQLTRVERAVGVFPDLDSALTPNLEPSLPTKP
jgi:anti-sigma B factor antagonist